MRMTEKSPCSLDERITQVLEKRKELLKMLKARKLSLQAKGKRVEVYQSTIDKIQTTCTELRRTTNELLREHWKVPVTGNSMEPSTSGVGDLMADVDFEESAGKQRVQQITNLLVPILEEQRKDEAHCNEIIAKLESLRKSYVELRRLNSKS